MCRTRLPEAAAAADPLHAGAATLDLHVSAMGAGGDGYAASPDGGALHIPFTLPGERVIATWRGGPRAALAAIVEPSAERVSPPCPHFGACGGCALQHWADVPYADWKAGLVRQALQRAGFVDMSMTPLIRTPPRSRRRMDFAVQRSADGVRLGLHQAHARRIVEVGPCPVLRPELEALLGPLRGLLPSLACLRKTADLAATSLHAGIDLLLRTDAVVTQGDRARLASFATAHGISRVAWSMGAAPPETAVVLREPKITFADTVVQVPSGAFLQASAEGETAIVQAVLAGLPPSKAARPFVIELFAGIGTLSFPLAGAARVRAFEGNGEAAAALRRASGGSRVEAITRDLTRQPLQPVELKNAAAVVLDPPFAGAPAQMPALAQSGVPVIYVSCNPASLAQDAAVLAKAGYTLRSAVAIDQFLWSAHVESVCVFMPPKGRSLGRNGRGGS